MCKGAIIRDVQERLKEIGQHMHNRSIFLSINLKATSYINDANIAIRTIFNHLNIMVPYVDIIGLCHSVAILWKSMWCSIKVMWGGIISISSEC